MTGFRRFIPIIVCQTVSVLQKSIFVKNEECEEGGDGGLNFGLADARKQDLLFRVYTDKNKFHIYCNSNIINGNIDSSLPTKFLIHGWSQSSRVDYYETMKDSYFCNGPHNIVYVDWCKAAGRPYPIAAANTKPTGEHIADFIIGSGLELDKVHIIGYSLGAHVAGFVGKSINKQTGNKVGRITLLSPAREKFENVSSIYRADQSDAKFVDVVHTEGELALDEPLGHIDYYPNGGCLQPGCPKPTTEKGKCCNHKRSICLFNESICGKVPFIGRNAVSWEDYVNGRYTSQQIIQFGEHVNNCNRGNVYFQTNAKTPFAMGMKK